MDASDATPPLGSPETEAAAPGAPETYQVLARKYRPRAFDDLIGHEPMVRTLRNAFAANRIAHAFILTGVRGVGKTTTARILARALNYLPKDAAPDAPDPGPQMDMPTDGVHCQAIAESRHPDVIEMDAASRTGVADIRELIEGVRYAPTSARYKVYIIDEVHMLSTSAFNALLKTLEEPPPHVKFIFATTEIRKLPVTVLSRCQRFDLRRVDLEKMSTHLRNIAAKEGAEIEDEAIALIARASEGSVRDALSLLDQAIVQHDGGAATADDVRAMLGLADRLRTAHLLELTLKGDAAAALAEFRDQYDAGADPLVVLQDLLELVHWVTQIKVVGAQAAAHGRGGEAEAQLATKLAEGLPVNVLTRAWNMLLKGLSEAQSAPDPATAADMLLIRLAYAADLPTPDEALRALKSGAAPAPQAQTSQQAPASPADPGGPPSGSRASGGPQALAYAAPREASPAPIKQEAPLAYAAPVLKSIEDVAQLARAKRDISLKNEIESFVHIVSFETGRIEFRPAEGAPADLAGRLAARLRDWTGERWVVSVNAHSEGSDTLRDVRDRSIREHPLVKAAFSVFPDAEIVAIRDLNPSSDPLEALTDDALLDLDDLPDDL